IPDVDMETQSQETQFSDTFPSVEQKKDAQMDMQEFPVLEVSLAIGPQFTSEEGMLESEKSQLLVSLSRKLLKSPPLQVYEDENVCYIR
ncbi:hypothetical protein KI387_004260, partial [Taxus chinensis]